MKIFVDFKAHLLGCKFMIKGEHFICRGQGASLALL